MEEIKNGWIYFDKSYEWSDGVEYIVDVTNENSDRIFRKYQDEPIIPFSKMSRNWDDDPYDGR